MKSENKDFEGAILSLKGEIERLKNIVNQHAMILNENNLGIKIPAQEFDDEDDEEDIEERLAEEEKEKKDHKGDDSDDDDDDEDEDDSDDDDDDEDD